MDESQMTSHLILCAVTMLLAVACVLAGSWANSKQEGSPWRRRWRK